MIALPAPLKFAARSVATLLIFACASPKAPSAIIEDRVTIAAGWHEWYELKVDPEESKNLMVCGNAWDPRSNALYGFVALSIDGGKSWRSTLEDRSTAWVSEQSCAFGANHTAYFVSDASLVIDGKPHHDEGSARLFVSIDGGQHWRKTVETGWADYSTSAISTSTGELVTFFNHGVREPGRGWGTTVGALVFSKDGKQVRGAFSDPAMKEQGYQGNLPSQATSLPDGSVVALYGALRKIGESEKYDLGFERLQVRPTPSATYSQIVTTTPRCFAIDGHALAYDQKRKQLIVVYADVSPQGCQLMLVTSLDQGKTWARRPIANTPVSSQGGFNHLAVAVGTEGSIGLLWEDAGRWFFSSMKDSALSLPALELSLRPAVTVPTNDSLITMVRQPPGLGRADDWPPFALINVRSWPGYVLRSAGLTSVGDHFQAVVPAVQNGYERLEIIQIADTRGSATSKPKPVSSEDSQQDVTAQIALLTGHAQSFDLVTGTLTVDLRLANRGNQPLRVPIRIKARELSSSAGTVAIENADNGLKGPGAIWDISRTITGTELLPGDATSNVFHLKFHVDLKQDGIPTDHLVDFKVSVLAQNDVNATP